MEEVVEVKIEEPVKKKRGRKPKVKTENEKPSITIQIGKFVVEFD
jgi:hypothetical protein